MCSSKRATPPPVRVGATYEVGTLKRRPQNANFAADVNPTPTRNGCKYYGTTQITTRGDGEKNTHRKQKTEKKLSSLGPGSVGGGKGKKRGQIGKISASEASPAIALLPSPNSPIFFFFAHANAEPGHRLKNETSRSPTPK